MNKKKTHIFVVSNPISCIHASVLMQQLSDGQFILVLDRVKRKNSFKNEIIHCAGKKWDYVIDMGESIADETDLKPSLRKRLTRKLKHTRFIKPFYDSMLTKYLKRFNEATEKKLKSELSQFENTGVYLYLLTQTAINASLVKLFPEAECNFFEHGLPDYLFAFKSHDLIIKNYYCLFNSEFESFTNKYKMKGPVIKPLMTKTQYLAHCNMVFKNNTVLNTLEEKIPIKSVLVVMQSLEKYELGSDFWIEYLTKVYRKEKDRSHCLVLKPHPLQSNQVLHSLSKQLHNNGIKNVILNTAEEISFSSEVLFGTLSHKFIAVYSPFSYSVYFLSHLFYDSGINFYDSYNAMKNHITNAPKQYRDQFLLHETIINECFSGKTEAFTF